MHSKHALNHNISYDIYIEQCVETSNNAFDLQIEQVKLELEHAKTVYDRLMQTYDYYEIQPHVKSVAQIQYNKMLYEMSKKYNIKKYIYAKKKEMNNFSSNY